MSVECCSIPAAAAVPADNRGLLMGQRTGSSLEGAPDPPIATTNLHVLCHSLLIATSSTQSNTNPVRPSLSATNDFSHLSLPADIKHAFNKMGTKPSFFLV